MGETKTPISFRNACDDFILVENLGAELSEIKAVAPEQKDNKQVEDSSQLVPVLSKAWEQYQDDEGWANVAAAGSFLKRAKPDFDPRTYGEAKLADVIASLNKVFEMKKSKGKGTATIVSYRLKSTSQRGQSRPKP